MLAWVNGVSPKGCCIGKADAGRSGEGMPRNRVSRTTVLQIALSGAAVAFVLCADYSPARAGDTDGQTTSFTDQFLNSIGIKNPTKTEYDINYSERSPLVVPPTRNLPAPIPGGAAPAPNWPVDAEVKAKQAAKDDKPAPRPYDSVIHDGRALTPAELGVGRPVAAPGRGEQTSPSELGEKKSSWFNFDWTKKEEYGTFTGEPPRVSLTDPPAGYQTPSANQPYGLVPEHRTATASTLEKRVEPVH
jgi:hypothetical protein